MNSALYECRVKHARLLPKKHEFLYRLFMMSLDLDELPALARRIPWFSHNRFNLFSFYDKDHVELPSAQGPGLRANVAAYLLENGIELPADAKVRLITFPRVLGYGFSPVSFFYIESAEGTPFCAISEVTNTYREMKLYLLPGPFPADQKRWHRRMPKDFYVSPYSPLDTSFDFKLGLPGEQLQVNIDDYLAGDLQLISWIKGDRRELSAARLLWYAVKYPLLTLRVIALIHWHALLLFLKRIPYHLKSSRPEAQTGLLRPHSSLTTQTKH